MARYVPGFGQYVRTVPGIFAETETSKITTEFRPTDTQAMSMTRLIYLSTRVILTFRDPLLAKLDHALDPACI